MMRRLTVLLWTAGLCFAQGPDAGQPPAAVDEALRARITEFFQLHVDGKYRQAEDLIAPDSKDYYYNSAKPRYLNFAIKTIEYSEGFTRARTMVQAKMFVMVPGFADHPVDLPIMGNWKVIDGQWYWYIDPEAVRTTPFGKLSASEPTGPPKGMPAIPTADQMQFIFTQLKSDKQAVRLKAGESEQVTFTNTAQGTLNIVLRGAIPGVDVKLDRVELKAGEKAVLSLRAKPGAEPGTLSILVEQTNQVVPVHVNID